MAIGGVTEFGFPVWGAKQRRLIGRALRTAEGRALLGVGWGGARSPLGVCGIPKYGSESELKKTEPSRTELFMEFRKIRNFEIFGILTFLIDNSRSFAYYLLLITLLCQPQVK